MNNDEPIKPETKDPIKEAIDHPNGPGLEDMINGAEEPRYYPDQVKKETDAQKADQEKDDEEDSGPII